MLKWTFKHNLLLLAVGLIGCETRHPEQTVAEPTDTSKTSEVSVSETDTPLTTAEEIESQMATCFVVIADTGTDYYSLRDKMFALNQKLSISIDTMGRYFDAKKNLIALPENDEDEIYAGDYFPRRYPAENLSLEYLDFYQRGAGEKTIALVIGIYSDPSSADSLMKVLKPNAENAFTVKSDIYMGCMH